MGTMSIDGGLIVESLHEQGYAPTPAVANTNGLLTEFPGLIEASLAELAPTKLDDTGRGRGAGGLREVPAQLTDDGDSFSTGKHSFIYDPIYRGQWDQAGLSDDVQSFLDTCHQTYTDGLQMARTVGLALDERYPGFFGTIFAGEHTAALAALSANARLAIMHYQLPVTEAPDQYLGGHFDDSTLSFHLGTDDPSFYFTDGDESNPGIREYHDFTQEKGAVFAGTQWNDRYPDSRFQAKFHGVSLQAGTAATRRTSAVLFVDALDEEGLSAA